MMKKFKTLFLMLLSFIGAFASGFMSVGTIDYCFFINIEKNELLRYNIYQESYEIARYTLTSPINIIATIISIVLLITTIIKMVMLISNNEIEKKELLSKCCISLSIIFGLLFGIKTVYSFLWNEAFMCPCGTHPRYTESLGNTM